MVKEKRILSYFICWSLMFFLVMFIGISEVFGATYYMNRQYEQQYYNNNGSYVTAVTTSWMESFNSYISGNIPTTANSYGAGLSITSPIPLLANHIYSMSVYFDEINNIALSKKNEISVASSLSSAAEDYANGWPGTEMLYSKVSNNTILQFVFKVNNNHTHLFFPWTTTTSTSQDYVLTQIVMEDLGSEGISQNDIDSSLNNQTNTLNSSIQNSTNTITGEIDDMEQSIINSNKETQDVIKDQFNSCVPSYNLLPITERNSTTSGIEYTASNNVITIKGTATSNAGLSINTGNPIKLKPGTYTFTVFGNANNVNFNLNFYDSNNSFWQTGTGSSTFTLGQESSLTFYSYINSGSTYDVSYQVQLVEGSSSKEFKPYGEETCSNKIDETNDKLNDLNGSLNNSNIDGSLNNAGSFFDNFTTSDHGGLSGIITAPLVAINEMLNTSCSPMTATFKGKELSLPCGYEFWNRLGAIQDFINIVLGGMLCYRIIIKLYKLIERIKNPEDDRLEVMDL